MKEPFRAVCDTIIIIIIIVRLYSLTAELLKTSVKKQKETKKDIASPWSDVHGFINCVSV